MCVGFCFFYTSIFPNWLWRFCFRQMAQNVEKFLYTYQSRIDFQSDLQPTDLQPSLTSLFPLWSCILFKLFISNWALDFVRRNILYSLYEKYSAPLQYHFYRNQKKHLESNLISIWKWNSWKHELKEWWFLVIFLWIKRITNWLDFFRT